MQVIQIHYQPDASGYFAAIRHLPCPCWLDGGTPGSPWERVDILVADPCHRLSYRNGVTELESRSGLPQAIAKPPLTLLRELIGEGQANCEPTGLPFVGGALGYLSYDFGLELVTGKRLPTKIPTLAFGLYDWAVCIDHLQQKAWLVVQGRDKQGLSADQLLELLSAAPDQTDAAAHLGSHPRSNLTRAEYGERFRRIQAYLHAGDCYQINFAQGFHLPYADDAWPLYQSLRRQSPAPYSAFLDWPELQVLSTSPELFLDLHGKQVRTKPIKGTRPRSADAREDQALIAELASSAKDRAENLMIVDLLRNDLGRVCRPGSVQVPELFAIESYPKVHHLVSTVTGELAEGEDALSLLEACFPGGSVTGAPKYRAMQIIDELEPEPRGLYCGSIGYIGYDGSMQFNIAIRTLVIAQGQASYFAGGGIVADSEEESEYQETLHKAAGFMGLVG